VLALLRATLPALSQWGEPLLLCALVAACVGGGALAAPKQVRTYLRNHCCSHEFLK